MMPSACPQKKKKQRNMMISKMASIVREHGVVMIKWGTYLILCFYVLCTIVEPSEPPVKSLFYLVQHFGGVAVLIAAVVGAIGAFDGYFAFGRGLSRLVKAFGFWLMALWLIGHYGVGIYEWVTANTKDAAVGGVALVILWIIVRLSGSPASRQKNTDRPSMAALGSAITATPSSRDEKHIAAHEAGHALVYAALRELPQDITLGMNDSPNENGNLGFIQGIKSEHHLQERSFVEWQMLVYLAGKVGQAECLGETTLGTGEDHTRWLAFAKSYLSNHDKGIFYTTPQDQFEQQQNERKLAALQAARVALLQNLFRLNRELLKQLSDTLLEKRILHRDDLVPILSQVQLPEEFPRPRTN